MSAAEGSTERDDAQRGRRGTAGSIRRVAGPVVVAEGLGDVRLYDLVFVGPRRLAAEVVRLEGRRAVLQVHEDTTGLRAGDPVEPADRPIEVELGPGLLGGLFDGVQRPLRAAGPFLEPGPGAPALDRERRHELEPRVTEGDRVEPGDVLGEVQEVRAIRQRILVPPGVRGVVSEVRGGARRVDEPFVRVDGRPLSMLSRWPVRTPRPVARRLDPDAPLVTGQRVLDLLFPVARGGTATIPGGFGTGKTVLQQSLARFAEVDVVVYVGCGERGNELTEALDSLTRATDPRTGAALLERTVVVANTSNMPIAAREASVYTGMTIAEYFRDQGLHVALLADSTSRWAEALREVSGRLGELPGEEGYPAYLAARLAAFYERAGEVECLGRPARAGSVTVVAAVSPPGGDLSEPVTQHSLRLAGTFWALDTDLARARHFPAVHWGRSYTLYSLSPWFERHVAPGWEEHRRWALAALAEEEELLGIVTMIGADALGAEQRAALHTGRLLREVLLQQSALDPLDACCPPGKQLHMLAVLRRIDQAVRGAVRRGAPVERALALRSAGEAAHMREWPAGEAEARARALVARVEAEAERLAPPGAAASGAPGGGQVAP